jgi:Putative oxidoreductase C terminal domain
MYRKEIIARENLTVMGVVARYIAAYAKIDKRFWWDKDMACGPIVEQGTHFGKVIQGLN